MEARHDACTFFRGPVAPPCRRDACPSFDYLVTILTGWDFAPCHTVTGMIVAAQAVGRWHHGTFHRLFAHAA